MFFVYTNLSNESVSSIRIITAVFISQEKNRVLEIVMPSEKKALLI